MPQLLQQVVHVVAPPLFSETAKIAQVLAYLGRSYLELFAQLLGIGDLHAFGQHLAERANVLGQPTDYNVGYLGSTLAVLIKTSCHTLGLAPHEIACLRLRKSANRSYGCAIDRNPLKADGDKLAFVSYNL